MNYLENVEEVMKHFTTSGAFLSVGASGKLNTMTISWGNIGFAWNKPSFMVYVRPQRYTKLILDECKDFTISVPFGTMKKELDIVGVKSGFELDKTTIVNFIPSKKVQSPIVEGCNAYFECKVTGMERLSPDGIGADIKKTFYSKEDYHTLYFGEIVERY